jgi:hypothetical protein
LTVTAKTLPPLGVAKPAGGRAVTVVLPGATPVKVVVKLPVPPVNVRGEMSTVPTLVKALATFTSMDCPSATFCESTTLPDESSTAEETVNVVWVVGLVVKLCPELGPAKTKPEGASVMVPEPIWLPLVADIMTVPLEARPST